VHVKWSHKGSWQLLTLIRKAGSGNLANGDPIFLRGHLGKAIDADAPDSAEGSVLARSESTGESQEFVIEALEPRTTTTTTTSAAQECVEKQSLGMCKPCLHTEQCEVGSYCCPYMKKCVASQGQGCFAPIAQCIPMCYDGLDTSECQCLNDDFPNNWQLPTCDDSGSAPSPEEPGSADGGEPGAGDGEEMPTEVSPEAWEHFQLLNELRAQGFTCPMGAVFAPNSEPLKFDCRLWRSARLHSTDMALHDFFSHTSQDGRSPWQRASDQGASATGENIVAGRSEANKTLQQLEASDHHCKNMMKAEFKVAAVGYAAGGYYGHYWTQMFSEVDSADLDTTCYPPETAEPNLLGVTAAVVRQHASSSSHSSRNGHGGSNEEEKATLLEPAVRSP